MVYTPKVNFHSIESIIAPIPRRREDVINDIWKMTVNYWFGMQEFMKQTNEKCLEDVQKVMEKFQITKVIVAEVTGTHHLAFYKEPKRPFLKAGFKEKLCAVYLTCLQKPELFKELKEMTPELSRTTFTQKQTQMLVTFYEKNQKQFPTKLEREELVRILTSMTPDYPKNERSVVRWFQNRRKKEKIIREPATSRPSSTGSSGASASSSSCASSSTCTTPFIDMTIEE